jgi:hypothetical protein
MPKLGCKIGPTGNPWYLVCRHVINGAAAIAYPEPPDELKYTGLIVCPRCDAAPDFDAIRAEVVAICNHSCHENGWITGGSHDSQ